MDDTQSSAPTGEEAAEEGGVTWESGTAADAVTEAAERWRLAPTPEHLAAWNKAIRDMNAALGSRATQSLSALQAPLLSAVESIGKDVRGDVGTLAKDLAIERKLRQDNHISIVLRFDDLVAGTHQERELLIEGQRQILGEVRGLATRVGVLERGQEAQQQFNAASLAHRTALETKIDTRTGQLESKIDAVQATVNQLPESEQLKEMKKLKRWCWIGWVTNLAIVLMILILFLYGGGR
jgi:hypothetical protein